MSLGVCTFGINTPMRFGPITARRSFSVWPVCGGCTRDQICGPFLSSALESMNARVSSRALTRSDSGKGVRASSRSMTMASAPDSYDSLMSASSSPAQNRNVRSGLAFSLLISASSLSVENPLGLDRFRHRLVDHGALVRHRPQPARLRIGQRLQHLARLLQLLGRRAEDLVDDGHVRG